jgi:cell division protein FtsQ
MQKPMNKKIQKILVFTAWSITVVSILTLLGFANNALDEKPCNNIEVSIDNIDEHDFVKNDDVFAMLKEKNKKLKGEALGKIDVASLERMFNAHSHIANAEVYKTIGGAIKINITTKRPIARIINYKGESFYLDEDGYLMRWSSNYTANLPVFTGDIYESYDVCYKINYSRADINDSLLIKNNLFGIYCLAKYLDSNEFWKAQIEQIYVGKEVELVPLAGSHIIVFGNFQDIDEKMNKLLVFYQHGLNKVGWNIYETINIKYKNQIVCTRATTAAGNKITPSRIK